MSDTEADVSNKFTQSMVDLNKYLEAVERIGPDKLTDQCRIKAMALKDRLMKLSLNPENNLNTFSGVFYFKHAKVIEDLSVAIRLSYHIEF